MPHVLQYSSDLFQQSIQQLPRNNAPQNDFIGSNRTLQYRHDTGDLRSCPFDPVSDKRIRRGNARNQILHRGDGVSGRIQRIDQIQR